MRGRTPSADGDRVSATASDVLGAGPGPVSRLTRIAAWSIRHRWWVLAFWVLVAGTGIATASTTNSRLSTAFDLPGQPAWEANQQLLARTGSGGTIPPLVAVVELPEGTTVDSPGVAGQLRTVDDRLGAALPGARTASWSSTGDQDFVSADRRTTFLLLYPRPVPAEDPYAVAQPAVEAALADQQVAGVPVVLTGTTILSAGGGGEGIGVLVETLLAGVFALVVLCLVFGSLLAALPLVIAAVAVPSTLLGILGLTYLTDMSTLLQYLVALIGLGIAIDFALLIVTRWREERAGGRDNSDAIGVAARTAGESVLFSGTTVAVSLAALAVTPVPFLRSIGFGGLLIAGCSVAVSLTLLPVVLFLGGERLDWPRRGRQAQVVSRSWAAVATAVVRHRVVATVVSSVALLVIAAPVLHLSLSAPDSRALARSATAPARAGVDALVGSGLGTGMLDPLEVLLPGPGPAGGARSAGAAGAAVTPDGASSVAPTGWTAGDRRVVDVWTAADPSTADGADLRDRVRELAATVPGAAVGGSAAESDDAIDAYYGPRSLAVLAVVALVVFLLLARALSSVVLPLKALALNAVSLAAAYGAVVFIWQDGHGSQLLGDTPATGAITTWIPLSVFALLFGLSTDYEVFILARIREGYAAGQDTATATIASIARTGRLITSGALILFFAFVALGGGPGTDIKVLATGLAVGILVDATIIRGVLAPALVALLGSANWWFPRPLARLLRTAPVRQGQSAPAGQELTESAAPRGAAGRRRPIR